MKQQNSHLWATLGSAALLLVGCVIPTPEYTGKQSEQSFDDELRDDILFVEKKLARNERDALVTIYQSRSQTEPTKLKWKVMLAWLEEDAARAKESYAALIAQDPTLYYAYIGLGRRYEAENDFAAAEKTYLAAIEQKPLLEEAHLGLASVYLAQKRFSLANDRYALVLEQHPRSAKAFLGQAQLFLAQNNNTKAREALEKALQISPSLYDAWMLLSVRYEEDGQLPNAAKSLLRAVELRPFAKEPVLTLARVYQKLGRVEESKRAYDRLAELSGGTMESTVQKEVLVSRANDAVLREEFSEALAAMQEAVTLFPRDAVLLRQQAEIFTSLESYAEALWSYEGAISLGDEAAKVSRAALIERLGAREGVGSLSKDGKENLAKVKKMVDDCYLSARRQFPSLTGVLDLELQISAEGKVTEVLVRKDTLQSKEVLGCARWGLHQSLPRGPVPSATSVISSNTGFPVKTVSAPSIMPLLWEFK